jgi:hypothetical protein
MVKLQANTAPPLATAKLLKASVLPAMAIMAKLPPRSQLQIPLLLKQKTQIWRRLMLEPFRSTN